MKNGDAIINNAKYPGANHFIVKEMNATFLFNSFVCIFSIPYADVSKIHGNSLFKSKERLKIARLTSKS